jgi:hypothetical protein
MSDFEVVRQMGVDAELEYHHALLRVDLEHHQHCHGVVFVRMLWKPNKYPCLSYHRPIPQANFPGRRSKDVFHFNAHRIGLERLVVRTPVHAVEPLLAKAHGLLCHQHRCTGHGFLAWRVGCIVHARV